MRSYAGSTVQPVNASPPQEELVPAISSVQPRFLDDDDDDDDDKLKPAVTQTAGTQGSLPASSRYFGGLLDSRSCYGSDFFPDPFIGPEFDKDDELEADYSHGETHGMQDSEVDGEVEWNPVGELTVAGEFGWETDHQAGGQAGDGDDAGVGNASGVEDVDVAAFHPIFEYVSANGAFDYTAVARVDAGFPTRTPVSTNDLQLTPYLGHLLRIGDHVSVEGWTGWQFTIAPHQPTQFIYGANFGYQISRDQLDLPFTDAVIPMFELDGQRALSGVAQDALFGVAGFDWSFPGIGDAQPKVGIGYEFPVDQGARDQLRWGVIVQFFLDF